MVLSNGSKYCISVFIINLIGCHRFLPQTCKQQAEIIRTRKNNYNCIVFLNI